MADSSSSPPSFLWQSGDFVQPPRTQPPFNGVEINAVPTYNDQGMLVSLAVTVTDFAKSKTGATQDHTFEPVKSGESFALKASGDFTVSGPVELRLTAALPNDAVVFVNISYGLPDQQHHADGGILAIPLEGTASGTDDPAPGDGSEEPTCEGAPDEEVKSADGSSDNAEADASTGSSSGTTKGKSKASSGASKGRRRASKAAPSRKKEGA